MPINSASGASCQINLLQPSPSAGSPSIRTPCEEYDHQTTLDPTTGAIQEMVTIQSQQASPFGILIDIKPTAYSSLKQQQQQQHPTNPLQSSTHDHQLMIIPEDYACKIILDGIRVGSYRHPKSASCSKKHITRIVPADGLTFQALQFAKLNLVDPDDYDDNNHQSLVSTDPIDRICEDETVIRALGTIQIDVFRCTLVAQPRRITTPTTTIVPPVKPPTITSNQMKFSERSKKARLSTSAGLAQQATSRAPPSEMRWLDQSIDPFPFLQVARRIHPGSKKPMTGFGENTVGGFTDASEVPLLTDDPSQHQQQDSNSSQQRTATSGQGMNNSNQGAGATSDRVEQLAGELAGMKEAMACMMFLMENSPAFQQQTPPAPQPPHAPVNRQTHDVPPHLSASVPTQVSAPAAAVPSASYHAPAAPEFDHLSRLEPLKIKDLWFSGDSAHLLSFLRHIRDFLRPRSSLFQSESCRIVWISRHFGHHPLDHRKEPSPVENWYNSLIIDNARQKGVFSMYADLDGVEFTHPTLLSVESFLDGLISIFGDKFMKENAKRVLAACKQRNLTIGEYNSQFKSLVYLVEDVEDTRIEKYVQGLNPRIIRQAMGKQWREARSLDARMELASEAAAELDLLAQLPPEPAAGTPLPSLSSNRPGFHPPPPQ
ncbi:hypothetical protein PGTUg99_014222 [Puccinia graminis f. sp. tritici]|uniref:Retrotransposon gag domain-containing protein n=1 Tax=Puccinia graminis f. sp. tritici TaxID=56615 RepID=A0A5B0RBI8_PUCGR|nr:hypothetical protein PGTUg99_014222 [Puccinia graminis f. sp. tritici]